MTGLRMKLGLFDTQSLIGFSIINSPSKAGEQAAQWMKAEHIQLTRAKKR